MGSIIIDPSALKLKEGGASRSYSIGLSARPQKPVVVIVRLPSRNQVAVSKSSVTFSHLNWDERVEIAVTAIADDVLEENIHFVEIEHSVVSDDAAFDGISVGTVTVEIEDSDSSSASPIKISESVLSLEEGGASATYEISLKYGPDEDVLIDIVSDPPNQVFVEPLSLQFTPWNWDIPQAVKVTAVDDNVFEPDVHLAILQHVVSSLDQRFANAIAGEVHVR